MTDHADSPSAYYDLSTINSVTLTSVLQRALNSENVEIIDWNISRVQGGAGDVGGVISSVHRFTGKAHDQGQEKNWSLILKVAGTTAPSDDPSDPRYWKREVLAYQSGRLSDLTGGLAAPRFFGSIEFSEKVVGLWLEDMIDVVGRKVASGALWPGGSASGTIQRQFSDEVRITCMDMVEPGLATSTRRWTYRWGGAVQPVAGRASYSSMAYWR